MSDRVDPRFGRAGGFGVVKVVTMALTYGNNDASQPMNHGAGIQAVENIVNAGCVCC